MNTESQTKIIRLNTGEDIIANCLNDEANNSILVGNPMKVIVRRLTEASQTMLVMMPWLPLEIVEEDFATINHEDIITIVAPKQSFVEYYNNTVEHYKNLVEMKDEEELFADQEEDEDISEETMEEMLELLREKRKNSIH